VLDHEAAFRGSTSRRLSAPWGLAGGLAGGTASIEVDGASLPMADKGGALLRPGQVVSVVTGGAGGYGDPLTRDRTLVAADLEDGKISHTSARRDYGFAPTAADEMEA